MENVDCTAKAELLFRAFAKRHGFVFEPDVEAPVELCWTFPVQSGLSMPITLGLQNSDELNFGVGGFWSHFFPFDDVAPEFERLIEAWIVGDARVAMTGRFSGSLEVRDGVSWKTAYVANPPFFRRRPKTFLINEASPPRS